MNVYNRFKYVLLTVFWVWSLGCKPKMNFQFTNSKENWKSKQIPQSKQNVGNDPEEGFRYMKSGEYIGTGVPWEMIKKSFRKSVDSTIESKVDSEYYLPYQVSRFITENGTEVINGNCFTCHATKFKGKVVYGLGDTFYDYTKSQVTPSRLLNKLVKIKYKKGSKEREAFKDFGNYYKALAPNIKVPVYGVNPAFRLAEACVNFRNPDDLTYNETARFTSDEYTLATDVPALWNLKKKNALYYNAMGRGDFTKLLMQSVLLGLKDSMQARIVQQKFRNVQAWIENLEPPAFPGDIDTDLAENGFKIFEKNCRGCHGSYGETEEYPNKVIGLSVIKTDPNYAYYTKYRSGFKEWYNQSWFATSYPKSANIPLEGYIAPPLDGVWATAPYLHNGSIPDIYTLLNSEERPVYWSRSGNTDDYNLDNLGWNYKVEKSKGKNVYNTNLPGYSNKGHYFGDKLDQSEKLALIEYLKTL